MKKWVDPIPIEVGVLPKGSTFMGPFERFCVVMGHSETITTCESVDTQEQLYFPSDQIVHLVRVRDIILHNLELEKEVDDLNKIMGDALAGGEMDAFRRGVNTGITAAADHVESFTSLTIPAKELLRAIATKIRCLIKEEGVDGCDQIQP